jgi:hypothetical protein
MEMFQREQHQRDREEREARVGFETGKRASLLLPRVGYSTDTFRLNVGGILVKTLSWARVADGSSRRPQWRALRMPIPFRLLSKARQAQW